MPYTPATPETKSVPTTGTVSKQLGEYRIRAIDFLLDGQDPSLVTVAITWSEGYMDKETYVPIRWTTTPATTAEITQALGSEFAATFAASRDSVWKILEFVKGISGSVKQA